MASPAQGGKEKALAEREHAVFEREEGIRLREELITAREEAFKAREDAAKAWETLLDELREANEHLVLATLREQSMTDLATQANRVKDQFLTTLAHELRNPLAPILNAVAMIRRRNIADVELTWAHNVIDRQIAQMTRLLDDVFDLSRITSGKIFLRKRYITISEIATIAIETSRPMIETRHQQLTVELPAAPLQVDADPERLVQVLGNLLNNASKYTQEGGIIKISANRCGDTVLLRVTDNGSGIRAESLPHIFELFTQESRSLAQSKGGLGIGLAVVRSLVELHGGTIEAHSGGPDQGSEFIVTLPLVFGVQGKAVTHGGSAEPDPVTQSLRIAIIEDNADTRETLERLLRTAGHEVSTASDGVTGVELVQANLPQVVLCDIGLPALDGFTVAMQLRAKLGKKLPVMIAITGYGGTENRIRSIAAGFDHHLVKPVDPDVLLQLIEKTMRTHRE